MYINLQSLRAHSHNSVISKFVMYGIFSFLNWHSYGTARFQNRCAHLYTSTGGLSKKCQHRKHVAKNTR